MQDAKIFCSNLIRILNFLVSILSFLTVTHATLIRERRASAVKTKEITIGHTQLIPIYILGTALSMMGILVTTVILWHRYKGK